jgi:anaerobic magnesium-protoporphyrin IX monomethyl ester cyclase
MIDLLLISPNSKSLYQSLSSISAIEPNIWAGLLANAVRDKFGVAIYDLNADTPENNYEFNNRIQDYNPKTIVFVCTGSNPNSSTQSMGEAVQTAEMVKNLLPDRKIGFIGPHVNSLPKETLDKHQCIDFVFTNEGIYALKNLLLNNGNPEGIKGVWYRDGDEIIANHPERIVPQELMEVDMPGVGYDLMPDFTNYRTSTWHTNFKGCTSPFASIYTSLGCFSRCSFCMINSINRTSNDFGLASDSFNVFRYWDPGYTIKQLEYLASCGVKNLKIADEMFVYRPKHFMKLCELIIEKELDFNIWAYSRVDTVKPKYLETLRKAGVKHLALGIESANQEVRQEIDKGRFKEVNIRDIVSEIVSHDIGVGGNFIVGLPSDNYETMQQTMDLALELDLANMNVYCSTALPGSPLYLQAKEQGRFLPEDYSSFGFLSYDHIPDSTEHLTSAQVLEFRDNFFDSYFTNQNVLDRMRNKYGDEAVSTIQKMTSIKIKRKILE